VRRFVSSGPLIALAFFLLGFPFIRTTGIHYDASYELGCSYTCDNATFSVDLLGHQVPLMVLPYLGTLKTWLYWPILQYLEPTPFALRIPLLVIAAVTVWLAFLLLERIHGRPAAVIGSILLATDATFLIASAFDFGPIVLLHFFLLAGLLLLLQFEKTGAWFPLAAAFALFGLALWHKALFVWMLTGLVSAALIVFPKRTAQLVTPLRAGVAILSLCLGASPLIIYNLARQGATFRTGGVMSANAPFAQKALLLQKTLDGSVMFGWLTEESRPETTLAAHGRVAKASSGLNDLMGEPEQNGMVYALAASLLLAPLAWNTPARRLIAFLVLYLAFTWCLMLVLPNTGATLHHVLLLWPFPHLLIAITLVETARRFGQAGAPVLACAAAILVCGNLLLINSYYVALARRGTTVLWTDAVYPLFRYLDSLESPRVVTTDWGYATTLCLLSSGDMRFHNISYMLLGPSNGEKQWLRTLIDDDRALFVDHTSDGVQFAAARQHLAELAAEAGRRREVVKVISDRNSRPRFEIFRYAPGADFTRSAAARPLLPE